MRVAVAGARGSGRPAPAARATRASRSLCAGDAVDAQRLGDDRRRRVMRGFSEAYGSWKTICISRRSAVSSARPRLGDVVPVEARSSPRSARAAAGAARPVVVLPQPDSPTMPERLARRCWNETPSTALTHRPGAEDAAAVIGKCLTRSVDTRAAVAVSAHASRRHECRIAREAGLAVTSARAAAASGSSQQRSTCVGSVRRCGGAAAPSMHVAHAYGQRGAKAAAGRRVDQRSAACRGSPSRRVARSPSIARDRAQQPPRVGVLRVGRRARRAGRARPSGRHTSRRRRRRSRRPRRGRG